MAREQEFGVGVLKGWSKRVLNLLSDLDIELRSAQFASLVSRLIKGLL